MASGSKRLGRDKSYCDAKKRQGEGTCTRPAGWGTDHVGVGHCKLHGGSTPRQASGAHAQAVENEARKTLGRLNVVPVSDPLTELSKLAGQVLAWKDLIGEQVSTLTSVGYEGMTGEQVRGAVQVFERAMDRCASVLTAMAKLNIDDRLAVVSEQQASMVADALAAVMGEMGLSHDQQREARTRVAGHLRVVAG